MITAFFMAGVVSVELTFILHELYPLPWLVQSIYETNFWYHVLVTGILEETAKLVCFFMIAHYLSTVKEPQDGVLQGAAVGFGPPEPRHAAHPRSLQHPLLCRRLANAFRSFSANYLPFGSGSSPNQTTA